MDAINHIQPDQVPLDFGAMGSTGMHCSLIAALREHYGLKKQLVKVFDTYQMLGFVDDDLKEALGIDTAMVMPLGTIFGNKLGEWKEWRTIWGQDVLIPKDMEVEKCDDGSLVAYPQGDRSVPPCAKMPSNGYFFDAIERQEGDFDEDNPNPNENTEEYTVMSDEQVAEIARRAKAARATGKATMFTSPGTTFSSPSQLAGMPLKHPKGLRILSEWYMALVALPDFIKDVFAIQTERGIENLKKVQKACGDDIDIVMTCTCDFGTQISTIMSKDTLIDLFQPYYQKLNGWIHDNTNWKIFKHSCGAVEPFIEPMIEFGFDILNPVQCSAAGMDPEHLKKKYGDRICFWGGGVDTQSTLPFGTPEEVRKQVLERCRIFSPGGGFVFSSVHNVQALTPPANVIAMLEAVKEFNTAGR